MPEVASPQVKLTVGAPVAWLYQPVLAGCAGLMWAAMVGAVVSSLKVTEEVPVLPATSRQLALRPAVAESGALYVLVAGQPLVNPEPPWLSAQCHVAVTAPTYQPSLPCWPVKVGLAVAAMVSILIEAVLGASILTASSTPE